MNNHPPHADELAVSLLRLGSLRVSLVDFTESLQGLYLWDELDPMTKARALQLHDLVMAVGKDLDRIKSRTTNTVVRALVHDHGPREGAGLDCPEFLRGGRLIGECMIAADPDEDSL